MLVAARPGWVSLLAMLVASGCLAGPAGPPPADPEPEGPAPAAVAVFDGCPGLCYEPSIAADPHGRIFVSEVGGRLRVSSDRGQTFQDAPMPPNPRPTLDGSRGDTLLSVGPDGRLWYVALAGEANGGLVRYRGIQVASTSDAGQSWETNALISRLQDPRSPAQFADRPWLAFGPQDVVYLAWFDAFYMNAPVNGASGVYPGAYELFVARSDDGGKTFGDPHLVQGITEGQGATGGQAVVDPEGRLIVPFYRFPIASNADPASVRVAISSDQGATFRQVTVAEVRASRFVALARSDDGSLLYAWNGAGDALLVSASTDGGATWTPRARWSEAETRMTASPWILARAGGGFDVAYYLRTNETAETDLLLASGPAPQGADSVPESTRVVARAIQGFGTFAVGTDFAHAARMPDGPIAVVWSDTGQRQAFVRLVE